MLENVGQEIPQHLPCDYFSVVIIWSRFQYVYHNCMTRIISKAKNIRVPQRMHNKRQLQKRQKLSKITCPKHNQLCESLSSLALVYWPALLCFSTVYRCIQQGTCPVTLASGPAGECAAPSCSTQENLGGRALPLPLASLNDEPGTINQLLTVPMLSTYTKIWH